MIETPAIIELAPTHYASIQLKISVTEIRAIMGPTIAEVRAALAEQGVEPSGPWFTHHFVRPTMVFDFEICLPVATPIVASGRVLPRSWPAMTVARTVFHGNYQGLPAAWGELEQWLKEQPVTAGTEFWEVYTVNPDTTPNPDEFRTELNWPVETGVER